MSDFKKTIATAKAKVAEAETKAFMARREAIDEILQDAAPLCCEAHQDEFKAEFLRALSDCVTIQQEEDAAEADEDDAHTSVH
jgi:hypothetical protein